MPLRFGPGPVFVHESIAAARRWQLYTLRSLFVMALLAGLALAWLPVQMQGGKPSGNLPIQQLASLGQSFYIAIATMQLVLVLIIAPAATAATICLDRARGTLAHMLVTDLSDSEIVLGKLAARLAPVLGLVAATVPVLALAGLLGGVIIEAIVALTLITLVLAILGCTLALAISVRASKTHEVLMAVYGIETVWVLGPLIWQILPFSGVARAMPAWLWMSNPFVLAWAPYWWPNNVSVWRLAAVLGGALALSAALALYVVLRLRAEVTNRSDSRLSRLSSWLCRAHSRLSGWRPGPSLDHDPVLWREWRRGRPSRLARVVWGVYIAASLAGTGWGLYTFSQNYRAGSEPLEFVGGLQATFGLLLVCLTAPTVLAEERVRGSLDVLMTTPLSTEQIVLAKWWGAFRIVPALALLPAIGAIFIAAGEPDLARGARLGHTPEAWSTLDRLANAGLPVATLLVQGAAVTSIGVALATWFRRLGRAVAVSVTGYAFYAFGWVLCIELVPEILCDIGLVSPNNSDALEFLCLIIATACPFGGQLPSMLSGAFLPPSESRAAFYIGQVIVILVILVFALVVLALTLATFDRCVGRAPERPRRSPQPPRRATGARQPRLWSTALRRSGAPCPP
jgi:ABC-type transport system involved in multi-copper enzyme maturation permease subunit